jgi:Spy/CpxP family protein refolding chaperone
MGRVAGWLELGLGESQVKELLELRHQLELNSLPTLQELNTLRERKLELREDPVANEKELKELAARCAELRVELGVAAERAEQKAKALLTEEQAEELGEASLLAGPPHPRGPRGRAPKPPRIARHHGPRGASF